MKRKVIRAITGLLCAAMVFSNVVGMSIHPMEDATGQETQMQESIINYAKTREIYKEYQRSRHKEEYRTAHAEQEKDKETER